MRRITLLILYAALETACTDDSHSLGGAWPLTFNHQDASSPNPGDDSGPPSPEDAGHDGSCTVDPQAGAVLELDVFCELFTCESTASEWLAGYICANATEDTGFGTLRRVGCGLESISVSTGYEHSAHHYDVVSGALVGAQSSSDAQFGPCDVFGYTAGRSRDECPDEIVQVCWKPTAPPNDGGVDSRAGCRAPTDPGCGTCCASGAEADSCSVFTGSTWYNYNYTQSPCRTGCAPCAQCTQRDEELLSALLLERSDCDCSQDPGVDACFGAGSCDCWCSRYEYLSKACPELVP
jgi:hypothetical protein